MRGKRMLPTQMISRQGTPEQPMCVVICSGGGGPLSDAITRFQPQLGARSPFFFDSKVTCVAVGGGRGLVGNNLPVYSIAQRSSVQPVGRPPPPILLSVLLSVLLYCTVVQCCCTVLLCIPLILSSNASTSLCHSRYGCGHTAAPCATAVLGVAVPCALRFSGNFESKIRVIIAPTP